MSNQKQIDQEDQNGEKISVNRREFLNIAWLASLGFLTLSIGGVTILFALPRFREGEFGGVVTVGSVSEIPPQDAAPANFPKTKFWLSNSGEGTVALYTVCTHLGCLYGWRDQENKFVCPCHGSQFEKDGSYITGPAPRSLDRFVVQVVDPETGEVLAEALNGEPLDIPDNPNAVIQVDTGRRIQGEAKA